MSQRYRDSDSLWISTHSDLRGVIDDSGEVFLDPQFVDQAVQEVR
jgi:hypothetical protein